MDSNRSNEAIGFLRLPDVLKIFPVGKTTWWEGVRIQRYPQPIKLSSRITAWRRTDILKLLENPSDSVFKN